MILVVDELALVCFVHSKAACLLRPTLWRRSALKLTVPVQVCLPSWTAHCEWQSLHSPFGVANSRLLLRTGKKRRSLSKSLNVLQITLKHPRTNGLSVVILCRLTQLRTCTVARTFPFCCNSYRTDTGLSLVPSSHQRSTGGHTHDPQQLFTHQNKI